MKVKILSIFAILALAITCVVLFFNFLPESSNVKNGFNRIYLKKPIKIQAISSLKNENYSFVKLTPNLISLYNFNMPYNLLEISADLKTMRQKRINFVQNGDKFDGLNKVAFIDRDTFILSGASSTAYKIGIYSKTNTEGKLTRYGFYQSEIANDNSFFLVKDTIVDQTKRRVLSNVNWKGEINHSYMPPKQIDGYFCTDGLFKISKKTQHLIYMYYYRGEFICLDSNLNIVYNAKTIDTITQAVFKLKTRGQFIVHASPPNVVNKRFYIDEEKIYMHSNIKSDNENGKNFKDNGEIDVYNLNNGSYLYSFYIPKLSHGLIKEFIINKNTMVVLYDSAIAVFKI